MAATVRLPPLVTYAWFLSSLANLVLPSPIPPSSFLNRHFLRHADVTINDAGGTITVFNSQTMALIPQVAATDGGGSGLNIAAALWITFSILVGGPLGVAGIRGWRVTVAAAIGLSAAVCGWAAFINTESSSSGIPDLSLLGIVMGFFIVGASIGFLDLGKTTGIALLSILGGLSIGIRTVLFRSGLLVGPFFINWIIVTVAGIVGGILVLFMRRIGILIGSAATGTFLVSLGIDLILNKQSGMSRGLRTLFDQNTSHIADILSNPYHPPTSTLIIMGTSLALIPILSWMQQKIFRDPFDRTVTSDDPEINFDPQSVNQAAEKISRKSKAFSKALGSRFSQFSSV